MKYLFYTYEGCTISPNNNILDSMQILGLENADTYEKALNLLFENNKWIFENGFDKNEIQYYNIN